MARRMDNNIGQLLESVSNHCGLADRGTQHTCFGENLLVLLDHAQDQDLGSDRVVA